MSTIDALITILRNETETRDKLAAAADHRISKLEYLLELSMKSTVQITQTCNSMCELFKQHITLPPRKRIVDVPEEDMVALALQIAKEEGFPIAEQPVEESVEEVVEEPVEEHVEEEVEEPVEEHVEQPVEEVVEEVVEEPVEESVEEPVEESVEEHVEEEEVEQPVEEEVEQPVEEEEVEQPKKKRSTKKKVEEKVSKKTTTKKRSTKKKVVEEVVEEPVAEMAEVVEEMEEVVEEPVEEVEEEVEEEVVEELVEEEVEEIKPKRCRRKKTVSVFAPEPEPVKTEEELARERNMRILTISRHRKLVSAMRDAGLELRTEEKRQEDVRLKVEEYNTSIKKYRKILRDRSMDELRAIVKKEEQLVNTSPKVTTTTFKEYVKAHTDMMQHLSFDDFRVVLQEDYESIDMRMNMLGFTYEKKKTWFDHAFNPLQQRVLRSRCHFMRGLSMMNIDELRCSIIFFQKPVMELRPFVGCTMNDRLTNESLIVTSVQECIAQELKVPVYNLIYLPVPQEKEGDPVTFYSLESIDSDGHRRWKLENRLDDIVNWYRQSLLQFCRNKFRNLYYDVFHHNDYNANYMDLEKAQFESMRIEALQLLLNFVVAADRLRLIRVLQQEVITHQTYIPTDKDEFHLLYSGIPATEEWGEFVADKKGRDEEAIDDMASLFDNYRDVGEPTFRKLYYDCQKFMDEF